ncbi:MAG: SpoIIE family protein phosphatase [Alkalispirochaeta sp.]
MFCDEEAAEYLLLVDDEPSVLASLSRLLSDMVEDQGLSLVTAASTDEALQLIDTTGELVLVMITDLRMPNRGGAELVQEVRQRAPFVTSIVLTGYADLDDIQQAIHAGIFSYETKPWDNERLLQTVIRAVEHARLKRDSECRTRQLQSELQWAGELQQKLLESELPSHPALSIGIRYRPLPWLSCGGDYYDVIPFGASSVIALIGDVAGHGIQAAFVTAILKSLIYRGFIRPALENGFSPGEFLEWLNEQFLREFESVPDLILTFSATLIDLEQRTVTTACAGHEPLYLLRDEKCLVLDKHGPVLGVQPGIRYFDQSEALHSGDVLTLITDGVTEYPRANEKLSANQLSRLIVEHPRAATGLDSFVSACHRELGMAAQQDDVTVVRIGIIW